MTTENLKTLARAEVINRTLLAFGKGMTAEECDHVRNILIMAELVTKAKGVTLADAEKLYDLNNRVLTDFGWLTQRFEFERTLTSQQSLVLNNLLINLVKTAIKGVASAASVAGVFRDLANDVLASLDTNPNVYELWKSKATGTDKTCFEIALCTKADNGVFYLATAVAVLPENSRENTNALWEWTASNAEMFNGTRVLNIGASGLSLQSEKIAKHLGAAIEQNTQAYFDVTRNLAG